jgi:hypothetical protein
MTLVVKPDFELAAHDMKKFLSFMSVRFAATSAGFDAKEVRFHGGIAPREKFHADVWAGFEHLTLRRANEGGGVAIGFEHGKNIGFIEASDALEGGDGRAHLTAFKGAEETNGDFGGFCYMSKGKPTFDTETAKTLARRLTGIGGGRDNALFLQYVYDGGRVESADAAKEKSTLEKAKIRFRVHAIAAGSALRNDKTEGFPCAQRGRRNTETTSDLGDAKEVRRRQRIRCVGQILSA